MKVRCSRADKCGSNCVHGIPHEKTKECSCKRYNGWLLCGETLKYVRCVKVKEATDGARYDYSIKEEGK